MKHPTAATESPQSLGEIFWVFTLLALQGFGGVMAVAQRELVEHRRWLTNESFLEEWAVAQVLPGPNVGNLAIIVGERFMGVRGAIAAGLGLFAFPFVLLMLLAWGYSQASGHAAVAGALRAVGVVVVALIAVTASKLLPALRKHPAGFALCVIWIVLTLVAILVLKWPLLVVLLGLGGASCVWTYRCLSAER
jgi:chromate transporter